jgi:hypothetical protein
MHASEKRAILLSLIISVIFSIATLAYAIKHGYNPGELWVEYAYTAGTATGLLALMKFASHALGPMGHKSSLFYLIMLSTKNLTRHQIIGTILWLTAISMTMGSFTTFKSLIPYENPFHYDEDFMKLDLYIFGGKAPGTLPMKLLANPYQLG